MRPLKNSVPDKDLERLIDDIYSVWVDKLGFAESPAEIAQFKKQDLETIKSFDQDLINTARTKYQLYLEHLHENISPSDFKEQVAAANSRYLDSIRYDEKHKKFLNLCVYSTATLLASAVTVGLFNDWLRENIPLPITLAVSLAPLIGVMVGGIQTVNLNTKRNFNLLATNPPLLNRDNKLFLDSDGEPLLKQALTLQDNQNKLIDRKLDSKEITNDFIDAILIYRITYGLQDEDYDKTYNENRVKAQIQADTFSEFITLSHLETYTKFLAGDINGQDVLDSTKSLKDKFKKANNNYIQYNGIKQLALYAATTSIVLYTASQALGGDINMLSKFLNILTYMSLGFVPALGARAYGDYKKSKADFEKTLPYRILPDHEHLFSFDAS